MTQEIGYETSGIAIYLLHLQMNIKFFWAMAYTNFSKQDLV